MYQESYDKAAEVKRAQQEAEFEQKHQDRLKALETERLALVEQHRIDSQFRTEFRGFIQQEAQKGIQPHQVKFPCNQKPSPDALECVRDGALQFEVVPRNRNADECDGECSKPPFVVRAKGNGWRDLIGSMFN
jgi:hypothetical protein